MKTLNLSILAIGMLISLSATTYAAGDEHPDILQALIEDSANIQLSTLEFSKISLSKFLAQRMAPLYVDPFPIAQFHNSCRATATANEFRCTLQVVTSKYFVAPGSDGKKERVAVKTENLGYSAQVSEAGGITILSKTLNVLIW